MYCPPLNWRLMLENRGKHMSLTLTGTHSHIVVSEEIQQQQAAFMCWRHPVSSRLGVCERVQSSFRLVSLSFGAQLNSVLCRDVDLTKPSGFQDVSILTHVDFTDTSGPIAMKAFMGDEAEELCKKPWAIIQVTITYQDSCQISVQSSLSYRQPCRHTAAGVHDSRYQMQPVLLSCLNQGYAL